MTIHHLPAVSTSPTVIITEQPWDHAPVALRRNDSLEANFRRTAAVIHLHEHPDLFHDISPDELQYEQSRIWGQRMYEIYANIEHGLLELGWLISEGNKLRIYPAPYSSMKDWLVNGLSITNFHIIAEAVNRYGVWNYIKDYNFTPEDIIGAQPEHIKQIERLDRTSSQQIRIIAKRREQEYLEQQGHDSSFSQQEQTPLSEEEQRHIYEESHQEFVASMHAQIEHILHMGPDDIKQEHAELGEIIKPFFPMNVIYNPTTGCLSYSGRTFLETGHLQAMTKGLYEIKFCLSNNGEDSDEYLSIQELAQQLDEYE